MPSSTAQPLSEAWAGELISLSSTREPIPGLSGVVGLGDLTLSIVDGRAVALSDDTPEIVIPLAPKQVTEWWSGDLVLTEAYMKGDVKPVGASGALFAGLELLDWFAKAQAR